MLPVRKSENWLPSIFNDFFDNEWMQRTAAGTPAVNIIENDKEYHIEVAAPGSTKDDFKINLDSDHNLVVSMEKQTSTTDTDENSKFIHRELSCTRFRQSFYLPENTDRDHIGASVKDGILTIAVPKLTPDEVKKSHRFIEIS